MPLNNRLLCVILFFFPVFLYAQATWNDFLEYETADPEDAEEESWLQYMEELRQIHEQPLNINTASVEDFLRLPFLTPSEIEQIHAYIYLHGPLQTIGELKLIPLLSQESRHFLPLFVYFGQPDNPHSKSISLQPLRQTFLYRTDIPFYYRRGYMIPDGYAGDPLYHRLQYTIDAGKHWAGGFRMEKDAGERYYDSYGAWVQLREWGIVQNAVLGDFRVGYGLGLIFGGSSILRPGTLSSRPTQGVRPATSMEEYRYQRGASITLNLGHGWQYTALVSHRQVDATLNADGTIKTLLTTGLHRTQLERSRKQNTVVQLLGTHLSWASGQWKAGLTGAWQRYSRPLNPGAELYRRWWPDGRTFGNIGVDYGWNRYRWNVEGETAYSTCHGGWATIHRVNWIAGRHLTLSALQRYYDYRYTPMLGTAVSQNGQPQNESGYLLRLQSSLEGGWYVSAYGDYFRNPWARYGVTHTSWGQEGMVQVEQKGDRNEYLLRYQLKRREAYERMQPHHRLRFQWNHRVGSCWQFRSTITWHHVLNAVEQGLSSDGMAMGESGRWEKTFRGVGNIRITAGMHYFRTDDWQSRVQQYESGPWGTVNSVTFYGEGIRGALHCRWESVSHRITLEGKYGRFTYFDREEQSSGLQTIYSKHKNDLTIQVRIKL